MLNIQKKQDSQKTIKSHEFKKATVKNYRKTEQVIFIKFR